MSITRWLEEMRATEAAMTKGPWSLTTSGDPHWLREVRPDVAFCGCPDVTQAHADAAGIVAMRNEWRKVLDVVEAAKAFDDLTDECEACRAKPGSPQLCDMCYAARMLRAALSRLGSEGT